MPLNVQEAIKIILNQVEEIEWPAKKNIVEIFNAPEEVVGDAIGIFSDGACRGNPGPGSWAVIAQKSDGEIIIESGGMDMNTTNNKMELMGAIEGLKLLLTSEDQSLASRPIFLYSDSKYVIDGATSWIFSWRNRNWKNSEGKPPMNLELWQELDSLILKFPRLNFRWVKGHSGHPQNEYCDKLCNKILDESLMSS